MKCTFCNKDYKRPGALRKHLLICEILSNKQTKKTDEMLPSTRDMFELIKVMIDNENLKRKITLLEKKVYKKKHKVKILDWLNENVEIEVCLMTGFKIFK